MFTTLIAVAAMGAFQAPPTIHFVVAERNPQHGDSYILPLSDPNDIRLARDLVRLGPSVDRASIVVCEITRGSDGINRDVLASGQPLWSWHVSQFMGFAQMSPEGMDGWPGFAETGAYFYPMIDQYGNPIPSDTGHIGFWTYTVTAELGAGPTGTVPNAATNVTVAPLSGGRAKINWTDASSNESGFEIERFKLQGSSYVSNGIVAQTAANAVTHTDTAGAGSYKYRVRSFNINGSATWSASISVKVK